MLAQLHIQWTWWSLYKDHPRDQQSMVLIHRWSLYAGLITWKVYLWGLVKCGLYKQVVFIYTWSLEEVWLHMYCTPVCFSPQSGLTAVCVQFSHCLAQYQDLWDILDDIDSHTWVLEPETPRRADCNRRIALGNKVIVWDLSSEILT